MQSNKFKCIRFTCFKKWMTQYQIQIPQKLVLLTFFTHRPEDHHRLLSKRFISQWPHAWFWLQKCSCCKNRSEEVHLILWLTSSIKTRMVPICIKQNSWPKALNFSSREVFALEFCQISLSLHCYEKQVNKELIFLL